MFPVVRCVPILHGTSYEKTMTGPASAHARCSIPHVMNTTDAQLTFAAPTGLSIAIAGGVIAASLPWVDQIMLLMQIAVLIVMSSR